MALSVTSEQHGHKPRLQWLSRSHSEQHSHHVNPAFSDSSFGLIPFVQEVPVGATVGEGLPDCRAFPGELGMDHCLQARGRKPRELGDHYV